MPGGKVLQGGAVMTEGNEVLEMLNFLCYDEKENVCE